MTERQLITALNNLEAEVRGLRDELSAVDVSTPTDPRDELEAAQNDRERLRQAMHAAGIDAEAVRIDHDGDESYVLDPYGDSGIDTGEDSVWRAWTSPRFGEDNPGWIRWEETDDDGYRPTAFMVPEDALDAVIAGSAEVDA